MNIRKTNVIDLSVMADSQDSHCAGGGMTTLSMLQEKRAAILALAQEHGVRDIRVFGSVARGEDTPESDIDLLVNMEKGRSAFDLGGFQYTTQKLLGRKVDVVMEGGLYHLLRPIIMKEARPL